MGAKAKMDMPAIKTLSEALIAYGHQSTPDRVRRIQEVYPNALQGSSPDDRRGLWLRLKSLVEAQQINPNALFAMAICDPEPGIAATCALDFVCYSGVDEEQRNLGIMQFMHIFNTGALANCGAVFGGLLAIGDRSLSFVYQRLARSLTVAEIETASITCSTGFSTRRSTSG